MTLNLPPAHRIARHNYATRTGSFAFICLAFAILWIERGRLDPLEIISAILTLLVYPHLAYLHARLAADSKRAELTNLYVDAVILGAWTAQIHFALWPAAALLIAICFNGASHGFYSRLFRSVAVFGAGAAAWGAWIGYDFKPGTGPVTTAACVLGLLAYVSWVGVLVSIQNRNFTRARNALKSCEGQFLFVAESVDDMVSVLDPQGRFLYASASHAKHLAPDAIGPGADWLRVVHPDDRVQAKSFLDSIRSSNSAQRMGLRLVTAKGSPRWVECQGNPVRDETKDLATIVLVSRDLETFLEARPVDIAEAMRQIAADRQPASQDMRVFTELLDQVLALEAKAEKAPTRNLDSIEGIRRYIEALTARKAEEDRKQKAWNMLQRVTLVLVLAGSTYNYYMLSVLNTINSLPDANFMAVRAAVKKT